MLIRCWRVMGVRCVRGVEVKLAAATDDSHGKHLRWLRERLSSGFVDGLILTTGSRPSRMMVLSIGTRWNSASTWGHDEVRRA